ncbi:MarR family winged helix-turn-helix transcriptional regulator [Shimia sp.]|uniref:MarR family winged helix-turn-helix transcriptional regulator n=1 Tax=Shimia sp. TaxID=1954381 RepID=UPI00329A204B
MSASTRLLQNMDLAATPEGVSVLAVALFRVARSLKAKISHTVNNQPDALGLVAWRILMGLTLVKSANQREIVNFVSTEQAQVSRVLKDLDARGFIASHPSPTDGRARAFSITDQGRACRARHLPAMSALAKQIDNALSEAERVQFLDMCARIEAAQEG